MDTGHIGPDLVLQEGYVIKSPPSEKLNTHRWHKRYCVLCKKDITPITPKKSRSLKNSIKNKVGLRKRLSSEFSQSKRSPSVASLDTTINTGYVLLYFEKKEYVNKYQPIKEFVIDDCVITSLPNGLNEHKNVIKIELSDTYNNRELYLCFENIDELLKWKDSLQDCLDKKEDLLPTDYIEADKEPEVVVSPRQSTLQQNLQEVREKIKEEYVQRNSVALLDIDYASYEETDTNFQSNGSQQTDSGYSYHDQVNTNEPYQEI